MKTAPKTLIQIQDEYIAKVNAAAERWAHRKCGGQSRRSRIGARHAAEKDLRKLGYTDEKQIDAIIDQAKEHADLLRVCEEV